MDEASRENLDAESDSSYSDKAREASVSEHDMSIVQSVEAELKEIQAALGRLDSGRYGICEACGVQIDEQRLQVLPATRLCSADQATADQATADQATADFTEAE